MAGQPVSVPQLAADASGNLLLVWPSPTTPSIEDPFQLTFTRYYARTQEWAKAAPISGGVFYDVAAGTQNILAFPIAIARNSGTAAISYRRQVGLYGDAVMLATFE
jgi:hypothetical protein